MASFSYTNGAKKSCQTAIPWIRNGVGSGVGGGGGSGVGGGGGSGVGGGGGSGVGGGGGQELAAEVVLP